MGAPVDALAKTGSHEEEEALALMEEILPPE